MSKYPLVSILMTSYNREKYIAEAIESVLASSYTNFELIINDDCSTDKTVSIAKEFAQKDNRIKLHVNENNLGDYINRNATADFATGKYIKYLDSDDFIYPFAIGYMVECMERHPDAAYGFCYRSVQKNIQPFPIKYSPLEAYQEHFLKKGFFYAGPGSSIIRKDKFYEIGKFSEKRYVGDFELWLRFSKNNNCIVFQSGLIWWRMHEGQEFDLGQKKGNYVLANYLCANNALTDAGCPLSKSEQQKSLASQKVLFCRNLIKLFFNDFKNGLDIYKKSGIKPLDILMSLIPLRLRF